MQTGKPLSFMARPCSCCLNKFYFIHISGIFVWSWFIKSFVFLSLEGNYKPMKNKVALHFIHISPARRGEHLVLVEILYDGLKTNSWHYRCSRKFTPTGMESFDQRLGSEMTAAIQISEFPKDNWHTIARETEREYWFCLNLFVLFPLSISFAFFKLVGNRMQQL